MWIVDSFLIANFLLQNDIGSLVAQLKDLQKKNTDLEEQNKRLNSKVNHH